VIADELVSFQSGCYLKGRTLGTVGYSLSAQYLSHAAQTNWLRSIMIQRDDVLDRSAQIRLVAGCKGDSGGTYILCKTGYGYARGTSARD
jgi:hypothetical protein